MLTISVSHKQSIEEVGRVDMQVVQDNQVVRADRVLVWADKEVEQLQVGMKKHFEVVVKQCLFLHSLALGRVVVPLNIIKIV